MKRILIVDDNTEYLQILSSVLSGEFETIKATGVEDALDTGNLLDRYMAQIRKLLLCQVFFLSGLPHFLPQSSQIINGHNHSPQVYSIVPICTKE